ncbi:protein FAM200C-like [Macrobrachium rosenbergii]|uniref:protein FAM200C-like n=1 Tax=Macrobrachium rosenbergii TaxID=79674 RepID=UPI0034D71C8B
MSAKKWKYLHEYIRSGFVSLHKEWDTEVPQCVICFKTLSNDGMRPSRLEHHLKTTHPALTDKPRAFFETKKHSLKQAKLDGTELVLGKDSANKLSQISLSNDTVKRRIDEMSQDIKEQILDQVRASPLCAIQCDEMTDITQCCQLLMYTRFVSEEVQEEFLELKFNSTAEEDFKELDLETFWIKYLFVYLLISRQALRILTMFGSTYLYEVAFSILVAVKPKYRNRLKNVEEDL